ncbi:hypothetical protein JMJ56_32640 [Belnapia sp. T18]|uniref:DUF4126 domain-containing protein n=2 Tax=Belnapia arida TaxID=2804533 RepID=A0ABS1UDG4_9PROT|nr:hypothetical protein [Belnapia arida]MBL6082708.1 hypothetical protein [Belnapia arida]
MDTRMICSAAWSDMMEGLWKAFGIGFLSGLRSMSGVAALSWAASFGHIRIGWISRGPETRGLATLAALAEMAGDKMPFAPDRRIVPSFLVRLVLGAVGGAALAGGGVSKTEGAVTGVAGAVAGTLLGRAARGGTTRSDSDWVRALTEDALAASLAVALIRSAARTGRT